MIIVLTLLLVPSCSLFTIIVAIILLCRVLAWDLISPTYLRLSFLLDSLPNLILVITILLLIPMLLSSTLRSLLVFIFFILLLLLCVIITTTSIISFYLWFELSLIPIVAIILGWGKQPERLSASLYILIYTISGSFPFLFILLYRKLILLDPFTITPQSFLVSFCVVLPFCVKLPLYYFHLWLPKAHVEAPVFGSMILAATLLKIGSYGVWRLSLLLSPVSALLIIRISLFSARLCSWVTMSQVDIKAIIAYSRVVHIGIVIGAVVMSRFTTSLPALMIIISHGICSSGLFYCATVRYERVSTRNLPVIQGLSIIRPSIILPWVLLLLMNLRAPPTLSLVSEILMSGSLFSLDFRIILGFRVIIVIVLLYSLALYFSIYHGHISHSALYPNDRLKELTLANIHTTWFFLWVVALWVYEL